MSLHSPEKSEFEFRLDNAAKIFTAHMSKRRTTVFRVSAEIDTPVELNLLRKAYQAMLVRCPYYRVQLRKGLFWYYLEDYTGKVDITVEGRYPCTYIPYKKYGVLPHRVIAYKNRIAFEVAHFITDGIGALRFLQGLLLEYFLLRGEKIVPAFGILSCRDVYDPKEFEDSFHEFYQKKIPHARQLSPALKLKGKSIPESAYYVITGTMDSLVLKSTAKKYGCTIGEFITAMLLDICQAEYKERKLRPKPIRISVPINLRNLYPSITMRNFALTIEPGIDVRLGEFSFPDIVKQVHHYMQLELDYRHILKQIARNIGGELNPVIRIMPLFVKDVVLRAMFIKFGSKQFTLSFSNLGRVVLPEAMETFVKAYDFIPPPHNNSIEVTSIAYNGKTQVSFSSTQEETVLEKRFFTAIQNMGINVKITTNRS